MKWSIAGKELSEKKAFGRMASLINDGPTGIVIIGAEGALKSSVIDKLWKNIPTTVPLHPHGGAQYDLSNGKVVVDSPFGLDIIDHAKQQGAVTQFLVAGAKHVIAVWTKYPQHESGWTTDTGKALDQILRDNPPDKSMFALLVEVEK
ncbi:hypothetical protein IKF76_00765 [Candidatus Saccharibacteria bacterium]|nr:hypothetical protein [Candidatus Saccharibacteria bacterium]